MQNVFARVRNPALRQGLIFGIMLGVILLAISFIITNFYITLALIFLAAFLAGRRASQETGRMATGAFAGLWTGFIGIFIPSIRSNRDCSFQKRFGRTQVCTAISCYPGSPFALFAGRPRRHPSSKLSPR